MHFLLAATIACTFLVGALVAVWQRLPWVLSERLKIPEPVCRDWQSWFSLPLIFSFPLVGHLVDRWNGQGILFYGILALALALAWLGQARSLRSALLALLLLCVAIPSIAVPTLALLPRAFSDYTKVLALNAAFSGVLLGIGLTPGLLALLFKRLDARHGFLFAALVCLAPALLVALTSPEYFPEREVKPWSEILQSARCWIMVALAFVYYLLAELLGVWRNGLLQQAGGGKHWFDLVFWIFLLAGPPVAGWVVWNEYEPWGLLVLAAIYAVVVGNMAGDFSGHSVSISLWLAAASFAPLLPTLLAVQVPTVQDNPAGVMGLTLAGAAMAHFLLQPTLERFSQRKSVSAAMWLTGVLTLIFGALALTLALMLSPTGSQRNPHDVKKPGWSIPHLFRR
jgi:MFS family permease